MNTISSSAENLFLAAAELATPELRAEFLDRECAGDEALRARVENLLAKSRRASDYFGADGEFAAPGSLPGTAVMPEMTETPGDRIGRYKLLKQIGEGGFGTVWMAEQVEPVSRRVALKIIKPGMDSREIIARFEAERQALAMMDHPNIAKVLDAGTTDKGRPFFVMELVRGIRITEYCDQNHLSTGARLALFITVCQAVQHAHQKGIIHRDIKPSNILVTLHDGVPVPKVIDFGIAKATGQKLTDKTLFTELHQFMGTPAYMSPEQAGMSGLDVDTRSDIYSLGVLLYELLTGRTPFDTGGMIKEGLDAMRRTIREVEPPRPSTRLSTLAHADLDTAAKARGIGSLQLRSQLQGDLDWIVMKCLEKDRTRRYGTANGLATDLKRHLENEPVLARPASAAYKLRKAWRRNKLGFTAALAVASALVLGLGVSIWQAFLARSAQRETEAARKGERQQRLEAQSAQRIAETERQRAEAHALKFRNASIQSRRSQYAADMFAATAGIERGSYGNARNFLREYFPREGQEELRGFEWRYLWQLSAGQQLKTFPLSGEALAIAWSPDGRLIAAGSSDRTVKLLRADTGEVVSVLPNGSDWHVSVAFSHDGSRLVTAGRSGNVRFWNAADGQLLFTLNHKMPWVTCSPAGPLAAIGTGGDLWGQRGEEVHLVNTTSGQTVRVLPKSGDRAFFSADGKRLASANSGPYPSQAVILWDVDSGEKLRVLENQRQVLAMTFSPDGTLLAIANRFGEIVLWNLNDFGHAVLRPATSDMAWSAAFSPGGRWLAVAMSNQEVEIWDTEEQRLVQRLPGHADEVRGVAFSPDGARLASGSLDGTIKLWDPKPPAIQKVITDVKLRDFVTGQGHPRFSPDSRSLAVAVTNGDVQILDATSADWDVRTILPGAGFPLMFSGDSSTLLTLRENPGTLQRWDATSGDLRSTITLDTANSRWHLSTSTPDGSRLALSDGKLLEVFETLTGRRLNQAPAPPATDSMEFSRDGQSLALACYNNGALWDVATGRIVRTVAGHKNRVAVIAFSPDQQTIATGSWDHTVRLWDAAAGTELGVLTGHKATLKACAFSPDGRTLVTGCDDRTISFGMSRPSAKSAPSNWTMLSGCWRFRRMERIWL